MLADWKRTAAQLLRRYDILFSWLTILLLDLFFLRGWKSVADLVTDVRFCVNYALSALVLLALLAVLRRSLGKARLGTAVPPC